MPEKQYYPSDYQILPDENEGIHWEENRSSLPNTDESELIRKENNRITNRSEDIWNGILNRKTAVLGQPFEHTFTIGESKTTVKMPNSDVTMTLPPNYSVEVNCTSFAMSPKLGKKLGLGDDDTVASPVVEYALTGSEVLPDYAVVMIPFIGSPADLKVRKFQSDEGRNSVVKSVDVPLKGKGSEDIDVFYTIKDSNVYIFTKSFSGFYCATCGHRPMQLRCFLFGSYKRFGNPLRYEVRVIIYIADELMKFADYKERMFSNESTEGRVMKKEMQLRLPDELSENDTIQATITPTESHFEQWKHKLHPEKSTPIQDSIQILNLQEVAEKCKNCEFCHLHEHGIPLTMEWYLTYTGITAPDSSFHCVVDVNLIRTVDGTMTPTSIVIDELQLRHEDRYPTEEHFIARNVQGLKQYLSGLPQETRDAVLDSLGSKHKCTGTSVEEMFSKLQDNLTPKYLLETVATVLNDKLMFKELDDLRKSGHLPWNLISTDVQRVCEVNEAISVDQNVAALYETSTDNQNEATFNQGNANAVECQELLQQEEYKNAHSAAHKRWNEIHPQQESSASATDTSDIPFMPSETVRPELSSTQRMIICSSSTCDSSWTGALPMPVARGELSTRARDSTSENESNTLPAQEHESMDQTDLKRYHRNKENN